MSMFDWKANMRANPSNAEDGTKVLSTNFWIYWAIALPLTFLVLLCWRIWWHREKSFYFRKYPHARPTEDV